MATGSSGRASSSLSKSTLMVSFVDLTRDQRWYHTIRGLCDEGTCSYDTSIVIFVSCVTIVLKRIVIQVLKFCVREKFIDKLATETVLLQERMLHGYFLLEYSLPLCWFFQICLLSCSNVRHKIFH